MQCSDDTYSILSIDCHGSNIAGEVDGVHGVPSTVARFLHSIDEELVDVINLQFDLGACKVYIKAPDHYHNLRSIHDKNSNK